MYSLVFEKENGKKYVFGAEGATVVDANVGYGTSISLGTSQGFGQIGETVDTQSVSGRNIIIKGTIYGNVEERKRTLRNICAPFSKGKLIFNSKYYTNVYVKDAPTFSPKKLDGRFTMLFYAPYPFFYTMDENSAIVGEITPMFSFPVNYATEHKFGEKSLVKYFNVVNSGDVRTPFSLIIEAKADTENVTISNLKTFKFLKINGVLKSGEIINIYRNSSNILKAELVSNNTVTDILYRISDDSTLFELEVGDNLIQADDDSDGANIIVRMTYNTAVVAVYED